MNRSIPISILAFSFVLLCAPLYGQQAPPSPDDAVPPAAQEEQAAPELLPSPPAEQAESPVDDQAEIYRNYERLVHVMDLVESRYVQPVESKQLFEGAVKGILESLDPYSSYIPPTDYKEFKEETEQQFSGIGITIVIEKDRVKIQTTLEGMPAFRAGVHPGDYVVKIDGKPIEELGPIDEIARHLRGALGTTVSVTFLRPSTSKEYTVDLVREEIPITTLRGYSVDPNTNKWQFMIDDESKIGYVRLTKFAQNTAREFDEAYRDLVARGMKGLIIDLRYNPGGLLDTATAMADRFLDSGLIVRTQGRAGIFGENYAKPDDTFKPALPLVVLVNEWSASASEILGAALKDHSRAVLVGKRTFGKGSVQNILDLDTQGAIKLTVAYYYTPSGRLVHKLPNAKEWGIDPDIVQPMTTDEQIKLREEWSEIAGGRPPALLGESGAAVVDVQLARSLDVLRGMLLANRVPAAAGD